MGAGSEGPFLEFLAIAFFAPIVAGIVAILTSRIGSSGKMRKLELIQKEMEVTTEMLSKSNIDDAFKERLRENLRSLAGDLVYFHGEGQDDITSGDTSKTEKHIPKEWGEFSRFRRYFFPPVAWTISGTIAIILYYIVLFYSAMGVVLMIISPFSVDGSALFPVGLSLALSTYCILVLPTSFWVRSAYRKHRLQLLERRRAISK